MTATKAPSKKALANYLLQVRKASECFVDFVEFMHPEWDIPDFHYELAYLLDCIERDELYTDFESEFDIWLRCKKGKRPFRYERQPDARKVHNAMVNMPPRHSKSTYCTELFPAYYMGRRPSRYCMTTSYNADLAVGFGRNVQAIIEDPKFAQVFPKFQLNAKQTAVDNWKTTDNGAYYSIGVGGTTSGRPSTLQIIDDPVKSRIEAESPTQRNRVWDFYTSALDTRLQPEVDGTMPKRLVVLTRWHPDDLGGRIQETADWQEGDWLHVNFQAITTEETNIKVRRDTLPEDHPKYLTTEQVNNAKESQRRVFKEKTVALWPERFPLEWLEKKRRLNERDFESLYQQNPYIKGGQLIKSEWWQYYDEQPELVASLFAVDTAFKAKQDSDYSVFLLGGITRTGDFIITDLHRGKYQFPDLKRKSIQLNALYRGTGLRGFYIEDKASGQSLIQELRRESGIAVIPYKLPMGDKVARANLVTPFIEAGRVFLPRNAPWLDEFLLECEQFPNAPHDDQVDALSILLDCLSRLATPEFGAHSRPSLLAEHSRGNSFGGDSLARSFGNVVRFGR